jgi:hypothetical protein
VDRWIQDHHNSIHEHHHDHDHDHDSDFNYAPPRVVKTIIRESGNT